MILDTKKVWRMNPRIGFLITLIIAGLLRIFKIDSDIPWDFSWSQGILTDGPWYLDTAIGKIQGLPSQLAGGSFDRPIFTYYGYFLFKIFGVGFWQIRLISVIPGILSVVFLSLLAKNSFGMKGMLFSSLLLGFNYFFILYNRIPMIYSTVAFFGIFSIWLWQLGFKNKIFFFLSYFSIILSAAFLKTLLIFFLPILILAQIIFVEKLDFKKIKWKKNPIIFYIFILFFIIIFPLILFDEIPPILKNKILRYKVNFSSNDALVYNLLSVPASNWQFIFKLMIPETILAIIYFLFMIYQKSEKSLKAQSLDWIIGTLFIFGNLSFFAFKYHPPRFYVFILPFMIYLATGTLVKMIENSSFRMDSRFPRNFLFSFFWFFLVYFYLFAIFKDQWIRQSGVGFLLINFFVSAGSAWFFPYVVGRIKIPKLNYFGYIVFVIALLFQLVQLGHFYMTPKYSSQKAILEAKTIIPQEKIKVAGPYAHFLGLNSTWEKVWFNFGHKREEPVEQILSRQEITHIAVDSLITMPKLEKTHPSLIPYLVHIGSFFTRGYEILVFRFISPVNRPVLSAYEEFAFWLSKKEVSRAESAYARVSPAQKKLPQVLFKEAEFHWLKKNKKLYLNRLDQVVENNPFYGWAWFYLAKNAQEQGQKGLAQRYFLRAFQTFQNSPTVKKYMLKSWRAESPKKS